MSRNYRLVNSFTAGAPLSNPGQPGLFLAVVLVLGGHLMGGILVGVRFSASPVARIPASTFLGPILSTEDFTKLNNSEDKKPSGQLTVNSSFVGSSSEFSPAAGGSMDKPGHGLTRATGAENRRYLKATFLNKSVIEKAEQQKFLEQMGLDASVPGYHSLRSFPSMKK